MERPPIFILGPTATGKTELAIRLSESLPVEVVNADALQVYRGLDVGTAKPTAEELVAVPHHLVDILDPGETFSAPDFCSKAVEAISEIASRGNWPLVVGGSGFYFEVLERGLSPIPGIGEENREEVRRLGREGGNQAVRERLVLEDPTSAAKIPEADLQRNQRALEVWMETGVGIAEWWQRPRVGPRVSPLMKVGLTLSRGLLYDRVERRVGRMVEAGWVREVDKLLTGGCLPSSPAFQAIGYRQVVRHINGEGSLEEAMGETVRETRRFAKRQLTWFRRDAEIEWFDAASLDVAFPRVLKSITGRLGEFDE